MSDVFRKLIDLERVGETTFVAPSAPEKGIRTFGGQLLAHTLRAAQFTIDSDRFVHSSHSYFLRPGDVELETEMEVETIRDGNSFSARQVVAYQAGRELFRCILAFQVPEVGLVWAPPSRFDVPQPDDDLVSYYQFW